MKSRAAVAFEAGKPLELVEIDLEGPQEGEVLIEVKATPIEVDRTPSIPLAPLLEYVITFLLFWKI